MPRREGPVALRPHEGTAANRESLGAGTSSNLLILSSSTTGPPKVPTFEDRANILGQTVSSSPVHYLRIQGP